jgi:uncharacterized protein YndB with AHSA1/START domain
MIRKSVPLHCDAEEAFQLFTARISEWWPHSHRPAKDPDSKLVLEETGRFSELARDGREIELGRVLAWQPPHRLALDFYVGTNPAQPTAVEVIFTPESDGTRVTIHHRPKPESRDLWNQRAPVFERSWEAVLSALSNR